jgi:hypothetical protein
MFTHSVESCVLFDHPPSSFPVQKNRKVIVKWFSEAGVDLRQLRFTELGRTGFSRRLVLRKSTSPASTSQKCSVKHFWRSPMVLPVPFNILSIIQHSFPTFVMEGSHKNNFRFFFRKTIKHTVTAAITLAARFRFLPKITVSAENHC